MPLDRPLPDDTREALKMLWSVTEEQLIDINRHRDSLHKIWHVAPPKPREGMLVYADGTDWNPGAGAGYYVYYAGAWHPMSGGGGGGGGYTTVQDEGVALTVRTTLNFVGAGVTATDDGTRTVVTIPGGGAGAVSSVFTRTGAVVAVTGDYTAAQVTNAVSTLGSYPNPTWITSLAYSKLTGVPTSFTPAAHVHAAADITTGVMAVARLGTGTPSTSNWLRGDGAWTTLPISAIQTPWLQNIAGAGFTLTTANLANIGSIGIETYYNISRNGSDGFLYMDGVQNTTSGFVFRTTYSSAIDTRMIIANNGNVGIGIAAPGTHVQVRGLGTAQADTFTLSSNVANTVCITESSFAAHVGGALVLGSETSNFCAIRGQLLDGTAYGAGAMNFFVRRNTAAELLDCVMRLNNNGGVVFLYLPTASPGAGTKALWADPADGYRVKWAN